MKFVPYGFDKIYAVYLSPNLLDDQGGPMNKYIV